MRNRWGVEIKRGYYAWASGARGDKVEGTIVAIDRTSDFARAYGPRVTFDSGVSVGIDDISQVLPPMRMTRGGVIKANPADIHIDIDSHNTKGRNVRASNPVTEARELWLYARNLFAIVNAARDAYQRGASAAAWRSIALRAARSYSAEFGDGASAWRRIFTDDDLSVVATMLRDDMQNEAEDDAQYASNPLARTYPDAPSQREHIGRGGKPTKRPSARLVERRLKTAAMPMPGVWANPLVRVKVGSKSMASKSPPDSRLRARRRLTDKAPPGFYANPLPAFPYRVESRAPGATGWLPRGSFRTANDAKQFARSYANEHPEKTVRVVTSDTPPFSRDKHLRSVK